MFDAAETSSDVVHATHETRLKWFNAPKGFGFVVLDDGAVDAFLHITTLQRAGIDELGDGARMLCHVNQGPKGAQVAEIVSLLDSGAAPLKIQDGRAPCAPGTAHLAGAIKWYKPDKGFGFVTADDGGKDIFLHKSCLAEHNLIDIASGCRVIMTVRNVARGREVASFTFGERPVDR